MHDLRAPRSLLLATTLVSVVGGLLTTAAPASANEPLVVIVDPGRSQVDVQALRADVASATGREVIAPADPRASASDLLIVAHATGRRWVLRYQRGASTLWTERAPRPSAVRAVLAQASLELASQAHDVEAPSPVIEARPPTAPAGPVAPSPVATGARPEPWAADMPEVLDPFIVGWDPLRVAVALSLMEPFEGRRAPTAWAWAEIVDPFAAASGAWIDVVDPWAARR